MKIIISMKNLKLNTQSDKFHYWEPEMGERDIDILLRRLKILLKKKVGEITQDELDEFYELNNLILELMSEKLKVKMGEM
jgi:hypothetical protein